LFFFKGAEMKITQSQVNITPLKGMSKANINPSKGTAPKINVPKAAAPLPPLSRPMAMKTPPPVYKAGHPVAAALKDDYSSLKEAAIAVQRIRLSAQQERDQIRRMRADAVRYQQETATRARSEAHQLILHSRLETQREIEELIRQASEEIQKVLADIRVIRITAQEELAAQRKFTDAAKLSSMSLSIKEEMAGTERKKKKQLVAAKA
jgi:SepF-like predicted cell division protein (DUF552 family)